MKFKRTFIKFAISLVAMCLALSAFCGSAVYAWFAINNVVEQDVMNIKINVTPNLVIASDSTTLGTIDLDDSKSYTVNAALTKDGLLPCTRYNTLGNSSSTTFAALNYLVNTGDVDPASGLSNNGYNYAAITSEIKDYFYIEKTIYIASVGAEINSPLTVSIEGGHEDITDTAKKAEFEANNYNAASVDFLVGGVYAGTLNLADLNASVNDGKTQLTELTLANTVPLSSSSSLAVTMLFYYDGSLLNSSNNAFVNTNLAYKYLTNISIKFEAKANQS